MIFITLPSEIKSFQLSFLSWRPYMDFMTRMTRNLQKGKAMITLDKVKIEL